MKVKTYLVAELLGNNPPTLLNIITMALGTTAMLTILAGVAILAIIAAFCGMFYIVVELLVEWMLRMVWPSRFNTN